MKFLKLVATGLVPLAALLVNTAPAAAGTGWTEYVYNPSGQALKPQQPPEVLQNSVRIDFAPGQYVALLTTTDRSLTGDLSGTTLTDNVLVVGDIGAFVEQNGGGCTPDNQFVRFFFTSPAGSGPSDPAPGQPVFNGPGGVPAGFYTQFWWSNPVHLDLAAGTSGTISAAVGDPTQWSDWNGKTADDNSTVRALFTKAASHVQSIGLSFGGGCFFENGLTITGSGGSFESQFMES